MALTITEKIRMPGLGGNYQLSVFEITGDGTNVNVAVKKLGLQRVVVAWTQNLDNETLRCLETATGTTNLAFYDDQPLEDGRKHLLFAIGY